MTSPDRGRRPLVQDARRGGGATHGQPRETPTPDGLSGDGAPGGAAPQPSYYMYVVECADGTWYTGYTDDVERRVAAHNAGRGAKYTRVRLPVALVASAQFATRHEAMSAEWHFKRLTRRPPAPPLPAALDRPRTQTARTATGCLVRADSIVAERFRISVGTCCRLITVQYISSVNNIEIHAFI